MRTSQFRAPGASWQRGKPGSLCCSLTPAEKHRHSLNFFQDKILKGIWHRTFYKGEAQRPGNAFDNDFAEDTGRFNVSNMDAPQRRGTPVRSADITSPGPLPPWGSSFVPQERGTKDWHVPQFLFLPPWGSHPSLRQGQTGMWKRRQLNCGVHAGR